MIKSMEPEKPNRIFRVEKKMNRIDEDKHISQYAEFDIIPDLNTFSGSIEIATRCIRLIYISFLVIFRVLRNHNQSD